MPFSMPRLHGYPELSTFGALHDRRANREGSESVSRLLLVARGYEGMLGQGRTRGQ